MTDAPGSIQPEELNDVSDDNFGGEEYEPLAEAEAFINEAQKDKIRSDAEMMVISRTAFNYAVISVVFLLIGGVLGRYVFPVQQSAVPEDLEAIVQQAVVAAIEDLDLSGGGNDGRAVPGREYEVVVDFEEQPVWGNPDAPVTIVEFSDFTCGFCGRFSRDTLPTLREQFGDQIRVVYMDFPFLSQMSLPSASAAQCARDQGKFWEFHDEVFHNQSGLGIDTLFMIAEDIELDMDAFSECYDNNTHYPTIAADYEYGNSLGVSGTPAFFVNGTFVSGAQPVTVFSSLINKELEAIANGENGT